MHPSLHRLATIVGRIQALNLLKRSYSIDILIESDYSMISFVLPVFVDAAANKLIHDGKEYSRLGYLLCPPCFAQISSLHISKSSLLCVILIFLCSAVVCDDINRELGCSTHHVHQLH